MNIKKLAEITDYSVQICRKYLPGMAMPDYARLLITCNYRLKKIAKAFGLIT